MTKKPKPDRSINKHNRILLILVTVLYTLSIAAGLSLTGLYLANNYESIANGIISSIQDVIDLQVEITEAIEGISINAEHTETPVETVTPTESIEPTETPIESIEPTETASPEPTMSYGERLIEKHLQRKTTDFENKILIWKIKINGETKIIFTTNIEKDYNATMFVRDIFSLTPIIVLVPGYVAEGGWKYYGLGPFKEVTIETETMDGVILEGVLQDYGIYGFKLDDNTTLKDLQTAYYKYIKEEQRIE